MYWRNENSDDWENVQGYSLHVSQKARSSHRPRTGSLPIPVSIPAGKTEKTFSTTVHRTGIQRGVLLMQWIHPYSAQHYSCLGRLQGLEGWRCRLVHHEIDCWGEVGKDDERSRLGFTFHMLCSRWGEPLTFIGPDGKTIMALLSNWLFVHPLIFNQTFVSVHL